jgi:hypothetical protein
MSDIGELKDCPFCGSNPVWIKDEGCYQAGCSNKGCYGYYKFCARWGDWKTLFRIWNNRV